MALNYKLFGTGPTLVILHGLFGSLDNWQTLAKQFSTDFSVYILDLRNHGKSKHSDEPITYTSMSEDLLEFFLEHEIEKSHLLGHSMGGKVAMQFAMNHPDRVDKLIIADMAPLQYGPHHSEIFRAMANLNLDALKSRTEADEILSGEIPDFAVRQFILKNLERKKPGGYSWKFNLEVIQRDYDHILAQVEGNPWEGQSLFIRGGKSSYVKDEMISQIRKLFPYAQLHTIEDAGHWIHSEKPNEFYQAAIEFLKGA